MSKITSFHSDRFQINSGEKHKYIFPVKFSKVDSFLSTSRFDIGYFSLKRQKSKKSTLSKCHISKFDKTGMGAETNPQILIQTPPSFLQKLLAHIFQHGFPRQGRSLEVWELKNTSPAYHTSQGWRHTALSLIWCNATWYTIYNVTWNQNSTF